MGRSGGSRQPVETEPPGDLGHDLRLVRPSFAYENRFVALYALVNAPSRISACPLRALDRVRSSYSARFLGRGRRVIEQPPLNVILMQRHPRNAAKRR